MVAATVDPLWLTQTALLFGRGGSHLTGGARIAEQVGFKTEETQVTIAELVANVTLLPFGVLRAELVLVVEFGLPGLTLSLETTIASEVTLTDVVAAVLPGADLVTVDAIAVVLTLIVVTAVGVTPWLLDADWTLVTVKAARVSATLSAIKVF